MQQIIDNLPVVVFEYYPDGSRDFTYLSGSCEKILGISQDVLLSGSYPMKIFIHRDDWTEFEAIMEDAIKGVKPIQWEGRIFAASGQVKWVEASCEPVQLPDGRIAWSGVISDIRERKELEIKQKEAEVRYREAATLFSEWPLFCWIAPAMFNRLIPALSNYLGIPSPN